MKRDDKLLLSGVSMLVVCIVMAACKTAKMPDLPDIPLPTIPPLTTTTQPVAAPVKLAHGTRCSMPEEDKTDRPINDEPRGGEEVGSFGPFKDFGHGS